MLGIFLVRILGLGSLVFFLGVLLGMLVRGSCVGGVGVRVL